MPKEMTPCSIKLMPNGRKTKKNQPDWGGQMTDENGKMFYISLWKTEMKTGGFMLSGRINDAEKMKGGGKAFVENKRIEDGNNLSELPFQ